MNMTYKIKNEWHKVIQIQLEISGKCIHKNGSNEPFGGYNIFDCWFCYPCILFVSEVIRSKKESYYYYWIILVQ